VIENKSVTSTHPRLFQPPRKQERTVAPLPPKNDQRYKFDLAPTPFQQMNEGVQNGEDFRIEITSVGVSIFFKDPAWKTELQKCLEAATKEPDERPEQSRDGVKAVFPIFSYSTVSPSLDPFWESA